MTSAKLPSKTTFTFRRYVDAHDRDQVRNICARVYNSQDYVPRLLPAYASSANCNPFVLDSPCGVTAFIIVRYQQFSLKPHHLPEREVYIEAVRVREDLRGIGVATIILSEASKMIHKSRDHLSTVRILSTTIPQNKPMIRVFHKSGWKQVSSMVIWPRQDAVRSFKSTEKSMLQSLSIAPSISSTTLASQWRQVPTSTDISALITQLRNNESRFFRPGYFEVESLSCSSFFLVDEHAEREQRSVWRLDVDAKLVGLLFVRPQNLHPTAREPQNIISACVNDTDVAESVVVFGEKLFNKANFHVSFDEGVTVDMMQNSPLFSRVQCAPFLVYEYKG